MREEIEQLLQQPVAHYLEISQTTVSELYLDQFRSNVQEVREKAIQEVNEYFEGVNQALSDEIDTKSLQTILEQLQKMVADE